MTEPGIFHSIRINAKKCIGCVACLKACPTKAVRIRKRLAVIDDDRCIDCGECLRVCSHSAIISLTTAPSDLSRFKHTVALPSPVIYSQFGPNTQPHEVLTALGELGFNTVYDEAVICEMASRAFEAYLNDTKTPRPFISSTCPVVVRLIQRLFPDLCGLIIPIEPPREIAAKNLRNELAEKLKTAKEDIGIIHITPCPAKMVSINQPVSLKKSYLDGAISISDIYRQVLMKLKKPSLRGIMETPRAQIGAGITWAISGGESAMMESLNTIAVSGLYDTIRILEDVESGKLKHIDFLECMICPDGCVGGPLTVENRFVAKNNILRLIRNAADRRTVDANLVKRLYSEGFFAFESTVRPKPFAPLDEARDRAIKKLKVKDKILKKLPGIDCGVCGAPDCEAFAEDVARERARLEDCVLLIGR